ncbi:MAG: bifunctional UDP-N-acetylglucosamine diphosphorylase/glucosamine-1-phosphate N-acetyltransferase GlmU [Rhodospirillales bacterium]|nr:bifunctional UDP-N-acetylglucosamine diphosphorylase/glucosamine-1-phosphate N-acetyltransferase GlmU [Rhodospirillales bacterium]
MTKTKLNSNVSALVLAAGMGTRMRSATAKVLHKIAGQAMLNHVIDALTDASVNDITVVVGPGMEQVAQAAAPHRVVEQTGQRGTGDAVKAALADVPDDPGHVLVLFGADPLIQPETIHQMIERRGLPDNPAVVVLGYRLEQPGAYGRLIAGGGDQLDAIVEAKEADAETLAVDLCNSGIMAIDRARLGDLVTTIKNNNKKGEYYLTDIVAIARAQGHHCAFIVGDADAFVGVDTRADLADAEAVMQNRLRQQALENGATLVNPGSVHLSYDTRIGADVLIEPFVVIGPGVTIDDGATVRGFSHLEGCHISSGAVVGPYARLRPGAEIGENVKIGNFVEIKNATFEAGAKASHLSYVGDARVGANANIGAGTITCNYDGYNKSRTDIGAGAFIGSNTALVAPVRIGDGAIVGAGSTIAKDVADDALAITRAPQKSLDGYAVNYRAVKAAQKKRDQSENQ